ncbi:alkaline shock response membrane anchor protein AmaP [Arthrobacter cheniae]|uniref:Alkaline shock response membrane anchor protein AmaP n=1 Tax=Arthrobacter cheniae TaxID=1258888 RepID=A0A3A5LWT7_9MICC|nr:alkaline shock response membrane anchor protein AmaP [Arthrobacter cheniae]RJT74878.1 alkaline shock response membrane anchor protein AmaP [Arthrobacter cheniae]
MRETAGKLNRTWLAIIGLVSLLLGISCILLASGAALGIAAATGVGVQPADPSDRALPGGFQDIFATPLAAVIVAALGVLVGLLALGWLLAQVPKRNQARTFRLHTDDAVDGQTNCEPHVISDAVEADVQRISGVNTATALLRGSASQPELNLDVKVDPRADVRSIIDQIHATVTPNLETALETPLRKTAVLVNVTNRRSRDKTAVL